MALKRPNAIAFNKKNEIRPFDSSSNSQASLEFWSAKNDASLFLIGHSTKKRPNGLTFVRMFDERVLDMIEVGLEKFVSMAEFKASQASFLPKIDSHNPLYPDTEIHTRKQAPPSLRLRPL